MPSHEDFLRGIVRTLYTQHQELLLRPADDPTAWIRRFALGYRLQKDLRIFSSEEWEKITSVELPPFFRQYPEAIRQWRTGMRKYWVADVQEFIDGLIAVAESAVED
jgi:hypothetical protein